MNYETGAPEINLALAIVLQAKKDGAKMWFRFRKECIRSNNTRGDLLGTAWWVLNYIQAH